MIMRPSLEVKKLCTPAKVWHPGALEYLFIVRVALKGIPRILFERFESTIVYIAGFLFGRLAGLKKIHSNKCMNKVLFNIVFNTSSFVRTPNLETSRKLSMVYSLNYNIHV